MSSSDHQLKNVILYDGLCGLCNKWVQFVLKWDRDKNFFFAPLQGDFSKQHLSSAELGELSSIILISSGRRFQKSQAVFKILSGLFFPFKVLGMIFLILSSVPGFIFISDFFYDRVAKSRYLIFGKLESCPLPSGETQSRFII